MYSVPNEDNPYRLFMIGNPNASKMNNRSETTPLLTTQRASSMDSIT